MCTKEGLHKNNAGLIKVLQPHMEKTNDSIMDTDIRLASKIVPRTSGAPSDMQWSCPGIWGK